MMQTEEAINQLKTWYGPDEGMRVWQTVMPGILADFNKMISAKPGSTVTEEYRLEDGRGVIILSGWQRKDGSAQIKVTCRKYSYM